jgi:hypothetical protein
MIPRDFDEQNHELGPPKGMTVDEVRVLPCFVDGEQVISCWHPNDEEREAIAAGGPVWLRVMGQTMPPCGLQGTSPFAQEGGRDDD